MNGFPYIPDGTMERRTQAKHDGALEKCRNAKHDGVKIDKKQNGVKEYKKLVSNKKKIDVAGDEGKEKFN